MNEYPFWLPDDWHDRLECLWTALRPDRVARKLYVVTSQEAGDSVELNGRWGFVGSDVILRLRPTLRRLGRYTEPGTVYVVDPFQHGQLSDLCEFVAHETAHAMGDLYNAVTAVESLAAENPDLHRAEPIVLSGDDWYQADADPRIRPWDAHDLAWVRLAIHAAVRARMVDRGVRIEKVADPPYYWWPNLLYVQNALGDEPERLSHLSLREVYETPSSPVWLEFCERSLERAQSKWREYFPNRA